MTKYYHPPRQQRSWFEGWYLKFQTADGRALALIPAVHIDQNGRRSASLQIICGEGTWWLDYPADEFLALEKHFYIRLGPNIFSTEGVWLDIDRDQLSLHGRLSFGPFTPLHRDIMGPFRFMPGMECSHGVISLWHSLNGRLSLNGETMDFSGGIAYIETDRGRSFPSAYLWAQCSWQAPGPGCLMLSVAKIPVHPLSFTGCICSILHDGRQYRLASYLGARIEHWSQGGATICQGKYRLELKAPEHFSQPLKAPVDGNMNRVIRESLTCPLRFRLWEGDRLLFSRRNGCAGFEYSEKA